MASAPFFSWKAAGVNSTVEVSRDVMGQLRASMLAAPEDAPEFGGILLGSVASVEEQPLRTRIEAFEPFAIDHKFGTAYSLSTQDRRNLRRQIGRRRRKLVPVGLYRSHQRRGLYLDQRDFDLFRQEFQSPASVFLLLRNDATEGPKGGIFVWEGDDIRRHSSYLEFPLEPWHTVSAPPPSAVARQVRPLQLRTAVMVFLTVALPLASFYAGRIVAQRRAHPVPVQTAAHRSEDSRPSNLPVAAPLPSAPYVAPVAKPPVEAPPGQPLATAAVPPGNTPPPRRTAVLDTPAGAPTAPAPSLPEPPAVSPRVTDTMAPSFVASTGSAPARPVASQPSNRVIAYIKPAPRSSFRQTLQKVIGGKTGAEQFVAASPVQHPLPPAVNQVSGNNAAVELEARIDRLGNVKGVRFLGGNQQYVDASKGALMRWRFDPARQNGEAVDSELLVRFEFHNAR